MEELVLHSHLAPLLDSPPLSPKISAFRGEEEEVSTPKKPGSPLPDPGSVQRLASRLNERIATEEQSPSPVQHCSLSPSPLKLAKEYKKQLHRSQSPESPDRTVPRSPSPLKKDSRFVDASAAIQDMAQAKTGFRASVPALRAAKAGYLPSPAKSDIVPLTLSPKLATRFAVKGSPLQSTPKGSPELQSRRRSNRLSASMPEAFAALREIEDAMRIIEKAELPMNAQALTTFNNTFWEPQAKEAPVGVERDNGAVMSGQVESHAVAEEPEQAVTVNQISEEHEQPAPAKQIAKELFPTGEEGNAILPDLGHILVGGQNRQPASEASHGSPSRPPPLEHLTEQLCTPEKLTGTAEGEDEWEFPQTPGGLTGPVSTKLWASPAVSPLPPPQAMDAMTSTDCPAVEAKVPAGDVSPIKGHASGTPFSMRRIVMGLVILTALLAGVALLSAYALPLLTSAQHGQHMLQTEHDAPPGPVPPLQDDSHALAIIPVRQVKTWQRELKDMAVNVMGALRSTVPLPAAKLLQLPSTQPEHATRDIPADDSATDDSAAEWHLLAHAPFAAMLAAVALAVHCLTRLTLSLMVWRCGNPCCARSGKVRRRHINGCTMCQRCGQWAARHGGHFWGAQATRPTWARLPGGRTCMCLLRDMGLGFARED